MDTKKDEIYKITPKGCAWMAMYEAGIEASFEQTEEFWSLFKKYMKKAGYLHESCVDKKQANVHEK